jgi:hypothetical protein
LALDEGRNPPGATNAGVKDVAWVFVPDASVGAVAAETGSVTDLDPGTITETQLTAWLTAHGVPYQRHTVQGFDVIVPERSVSPADVTT